MKLRHEASSFARVVVTPRLGVKVPQAWHPSESREMAKQLPNSNLSLKHEPRVLAYNSSVRGDDSDVNSLNR